jgi:hypothetical protein
MKKAKEMVGAGEQPNSDMAAELLKFSKSKRHDPRITFEAIRSRIKKRFIYDVQQAVEAADGEDEDDDEE